LASKIYTAKGSNQTPFNPQLEHFDFICGQTIKENRILKFVVVIACLSFFLSIGITIFAINRPDSIPVLVTMNDFGQTQYIGAVSRKNWQGFNIPEIAITYQVKDYINLYKSLSSDKVVVKKNIEKTYHLLTSLSSSKYSTLLKENNPYKDFGSYTKDVEFETDPLKISANTYQVDYKITKRTLDGRNIEQKRERAVISINCLEPTDDDIKDNPLGIYITDFDIKEIQ
jgi:type IV secretion system protein VirB5